jgi:hypothetical protein
MLSAQHELNRIHAALTAEPPPPPSQYGELYAAQQALVWVCDPVTFKAPYEMLVIGTRGDSKGCSAENCHSGSSDTFGLHAV